MEAIERQPDAVTRFMAASEENYIFACQAAVPLILSTDLVWQLWNNFKVFQYCIEPPLPPQRISHFAVSDLLLSPLCKKIGYNLYEMDAAVRKALLRGLDDNLGEQRKRLIALFLSDYADLESPLYQRRDLKNIHKLTALSILDPAKMADQLADIFEASTTDSEKNGYLSLYSSLLDLTFGDSDAVNVKDGSLGLTFVAADDEFDANVMRIKLPAKIAASIKPAVNERAVALVENCLKSKSTTLDLGDCGLTEFDFEEGSVLATQLKQCVQLKTLILANSQNVFAKDAPAGKKRNSFKNLPAIISSLSGLTDLICCGDPNLPYKISDISILTNPNLAYIDLSWNNLTSTKEFARFANLRYLHLSNNHINDLSGLDSLKELQLIDLRANEIADIKPITPLLRDKLRGLEINYADNAMGYAINVFGNPLTMPPIEIVKSGKNAVLAYFDDVGGGTSDPEWINKSRERSELVGSIELEGMFGTCFLMKGGDLYPPLGEKPVVITANHVINTNRNDAKGYFIRFPLLNPSRVFYSGGVWFNAPELDFAILQFEPDDEQLIRKLTANSIFFPLRADLTSIGLHELILISSSSDKRIAIERDGILTEIATRSITYIIKNTGIGQSGSPIFNANWELIGMHLMSAYNSPVGERGGSKGISIDTIINAINYSRSKTCTVYLSLGSLVEASQKLIRKQLRELSEKLQSEGQMVLRLLGDVENPSRSRTQRMQDIDQADIFVLVSVDFIQAKEQAFDISYATEQLTKRSQLTILPFFPVLSDKKSNAQLEKNKTQIERYAPIRSYADVDELLSYLSEVVEGLIIGEFTNPDYQPVDLAIRKLSVEYEEARRRMPSGYRRTVLMTSIINRMIEKSNLIIPYLGRLTHSAFSGERLAAIAALQAVPDIRYANWLAEHIGDGEKPFIGYQAAVALQHIVNRYSREEPYELLNIWQKAMASMAVSTFQNTDEVIVLSNISSILNRTHIDTKPNMNAALSGFPDEWGGWYLQGELKVQFKMKMWFQGTDLFGVTNEQGQLGKADITGKLFVAERRLQFTKIYRANNTYSITYYGGWDEKFAVKGYWEISKNNADGFEMSPGFVEFFGAK